MTVLIPPRIYFSGGTSFNPCTSNNNDQWPTYDFPTAELNFEYLKTQSVDGRALTEEFYLTNPDGFRADFRKWVLTLQTYPPPSDDGETTRWKQMPSEWNYWGGNSTQFVQSSSVGGITTNVTGGQLVYGTDPSNPPVVTNDPLVGMPIQIVGPPREVDVNPDAFWSTQIYLRGLEIGDPNAPSLSALVPEGIRMHSRWINFQRNLNEPAEDPKVQIAGVGGCVFQIGLPTPGVTINNPGGSSQLLTHLQNALNSAGVRGVQLRYAVYLTKYWSSEEILDQIPQLKGCLALPSKRKLPDGNYYNDMITCQYQKLPEFWNDEKHTSNPAIAKVVGTVGIWDNSEPSTVPWQRYVPSYIDEDKLQQGYAPNPLGCSDAFIDTRARILSLDLGNTIPETDQRGEKYNLGDIEVGIHSGTGYQPIPGFATLKPSDYDSTAYLRTAGIVDMAIPPGVPTEGRVMLMAQEKFVYRGSNSTQMVVAAAESDDQLVVQTDQRGVYIEQNQTGSMSFDVLYNGPPPKNRTVYVTIAQYLPVPAPPAADAGAWQLVGSSLNGGPPRAPVAYFLTPGRPSEVLTAQVQLDGNGIGQGNFGILPIEPGFPTYVFFPHLDLDKPPMLPPEIKPVAPGLTTLNAFYGCVRILPYDDALPREFAGCWNDNKDEDKAYHFVQTKIFAVYAMIYPIMDYVVGTKASLIEYNSRIQQRTSAAAVDSTGYMPVTRELSAGKRQVISMWGQLVDNKFDPSFNFPASGLSRTAATNA